MNDVTSIPPSAPHRTAWIQARSASECIARSSLASGRDRKPCGWGCTRWRFGLVFGARTQGGGGNHERTGADRDEILAGVDKLLRSKTSTPPPVVTGHDAAVAVVDLMQNTFARISPGRHRRRLRQGRRQGLARGRRRPLVAVWRRHDRGDRRWLPLPRPPLGRRLEGGRRRPRDRPSARSILRPCSHSTPTTASCPRRPSTRSAPCSDGSPRPQPQPAGTAVFHDSGARTEAHRQAPETGSQRPLEGQSGLNSSVGSRWSDHAKASARPGRARLRPSRISGSSLGGPGSVRAAFLARPWEGEAPSEPHVWLVPGRARLRPSRISGQSGLGRSLAFGEGQGDTWDHRQALDRLASYLIK